MYKKPRQKSGLCDDSCARYSEKLFTQIYKALYGDAMFIPLRGANMAAGNRHVYGFPTMREFIA